MEGDQTETEATSSHGAVATEEVPPTPEGAESADNAAGGDEESQPKADWRSLIRDVPPEELLKEHEALGKYLEGKAGQTGQRLAKEKYLPEELAKERDRLREEVRSEERARLAREEREKRYDTLADLAERDPDAAASELRRLRSEEKTEAQAKVTESEITNLVTDAYHRGISEFDTQTLGPLFRLLHPEDQTKLSGKEYANGPAGRIQYVTELMQLREARAVTEAVEKAKADWEKDLDPKLKAEREAARKEALGEANGGTKVDTGSGVASGGAPNLADILSWPTEKRTEFRKNNPAQYNQAVSAAAKART